MKNQYFADINDYRKYGIIRILADDGRLKSAICWMLTENDSRMDGNFTDYLNFPNKWRKYDPFLYNMLAQYIKDKNGRSVKYAEEIGLIPSATYFFDLLTSDKVQRHKYFETVYEKSQNCDLVFFDPDNGIEINSVSLGSKESNKYIYWPEIIKTFESRKSLLIYQHFIRVKRDLFIQRLVTEFYEHLGIREMYTLSTSHVLFLLVPQPIHQTIFAEQCEKISSNWISQINVQKHVLSKT